MPVFDKITKEMLDKFYQDLVSGLDILCDTLDENLLCYMFLKLYEFTQCWVKFNNAGQQDLCNVKVSNKDLKLCLDSKSEQQLYFINNMLHIRNAIGHHSFDEVGNILKLLSNPKFYIVMRKFKLDEELVSKLQRVEYLFSSKKTLKDECMKDCKRFIVLGRKKQATAGVVLASLYKKYPKLIVDDCFLSMIKNECFI